MKMVSVVVPSAVDQFLPCVTVLGPGDETRRTSSRRRDVSTHALAIPPGSPLANVRHNPRSASPARPAKARDLPKPT